MRGRASVLIVENKNVDILSMDDALMQKRDIYVVPSHLPSIRYSPTPPSTHNHIHSSIRSISEKSGGALLNTQRPFASSAVPTLLIHT